MMKKYLLFAGLCYYADGGVDGLQANSDNIAVLQAEAHLYQQNHPYDSTHFEGWAQIVEHETMDIIYTGRYDHTDGDRWIWVKKK